MTYQPEQIPTPILPALSVLDTDNVALSGGLEFILKRQNTSTGFCIACDTRCIHMISFRLDNNNLKQ